MDRLADTIVAVATPPGKGAIAIVRISGPQTRELAAKLFWQRSKSELKPRMATYGTVVDEAGAMIDHGVAIFSAAPRSYTGEDTLELQIHGSPAATREVMRAAIACGARYATPGEFTRRAFLNGKLDLHAISAVADLIDAETQSATRAAAANLAGGLTAEIRDLRTRLAHMLEELAASIDFSDEVADPDRQRLRSELQEIAERLRELLRTGEAGRLVREGLSVAIVGPPNAGKSSLLNALLGEERAIVSEIPGTTRDTIEESISIEGVPVRLVDTAGIREHGDRLEAAGIERTQRALSSARLAILVLDGSQPLSREGRAILEQTREMPRVVFANKADAGTAGAAELNGRGSVVGSVFFPKTLTQLREAIARAGWGGELPDLERPHLAALYELDAIREALDALEAVLETARRGDPLDLAAPDLQRAFGALDHLTGEGVTEELLTGIFARFCIGK